MTEGLAGVVWDLRSDTAHLTEDLASETQLRQEGQARQAEVSAGLQVRMDDTASAVQQLRHESEAMVCAALRQMCAFSGQLLAWSGGHAQALEALRREREDAAQRLGDLEARLDAVAGRQADGSRSASQELAEMGAKFVIFDSQLAALQAAAQRAPAEGEGLAGRVQQLEAEVRRLQTVSPQLASAVMARSSALVDAQWGRMEGALQDVRAMTRDGLAQCTAAIDGISAANAKSDTRLKQALAACEAHVVARLQTELTLARTNMSETYATKAELRASAAEHQAAKEELQRWAGEVEGVRAKADGVAESYAALKAQVEEGLTAAQASAAQQDKATAELQALAAALAETREQVAQQSEAAESQGQQWEPLQRAVEQLRCADVDLAAALAAAWQEAEAQITAQAAAVEQLRAGAEDGHEATAQQLAACLADVASLHAAVADLGQTTGQLSVDVTALSSEGQRTAAAVAELRCAGEAQAERQQQQAARQAQAEAALEAHGAAVGELRAGLEGCSQNEAQLTQQVNSLKRSVRDAAGAVEELRAAQEAWQGLQGRLAEEQQQRCRRLEGEVQRCTLTLTALQGDVLYQPGPRDPDRGAATAAAELRPLAAALAELQAGHRELAAAQRQARADWGQAAGATEGRLVALETAMPALQQAVAAAQLLQEEVSHLSDALHRSAAGTTDAFFSELEVVQRQLREEQAQLQAHTSSAFQGWEAALAAVQADVYRVAEGQRQQREAVVGCQGALQSTQHTLQQCI
eukprot:EG_transcript_1902